MEFETLLEVLRSAGTLLLGGLALYFKFSTKAKTKARELQEIIAEITAKAVVFIKEAEADYKDTTEAGGKKFNQVVNKLYDLVPDQLHAIITYEMIEEIVQSTFDEIEEYVKMQLDKAADKIEG